MPTHEYWLNDDVVSTTWVAPITSDELSNSFGNLAQHVKQSDHTVHVLFDITQSGLLPVQAPVLFMRSGLTLSSHLGNIAVVGMHTTAQILARIAVDMTRRPIRFFETETEALNYLLEKV